MTTAVIKLSNNLSFNSNSREQPNKFQFFTHQRVENIMKAALIELAFAFVLTALTSCFVATGTGVIILGAVAVTSLSMNILIRGSIEWTMDVAKKEPGNKIINIFTSILKNFLAYDFAVLTLLTGNTLIHEFGHYVSFRTLFTLKHPPVITVTPISGASTDCMITGLSSVGESLGMKNARLFTSAAGTLSSLIAAIIGILAAHLVKKKYPEASRYLNAMAIISVAHHSFYALSALWSTLASNPGHDFAYLANGGISPIICALTIIAIPLIVKGGLLLVDMVKGYGAFSVSKSNQQAVITYIKN